MSGAPSPDSARGLLRHTLATLSYRAAKCLSDVAPDFPTFTTAPGARTPSQILAHMGDLLDWALAMAEDRHGWKNSTPRPWDEERARFFAALQAFDRYLESDQPLGCEPERLFQGPVADALTHTGQIAYLRRLAGKPVRGENYVKATIVAGGIAASYDAPRLEFD